MVLTRWVSKDGYFSAFLVNLFQCLTALIVIPPAPLVSNKNFTCSTIASHCFTFEKKSLSPSFLWPLFKTVKDHNLVHPLSFSYPGWINLILPPLLTGHILYPSVISNGPPSDLLQFFNISPALGGANWTPYCRCGLMSAD